MDYIKLVTKNRSLFVLTKKFIHEDDKENYYQEYSLLKINTDGDLVFQRKYETSGKYKRLNNIRVSEFKNGDLLLAALATQVETEGQSENKDEQGIYLARISQTGDIVWKRFYRPRIYPFTVNMFGNDNFTLISNPFTFYEFNQDGRLKSVTDYTDKETFVTYPVSRADSNKHLLVGMRDYGESGQVGWLINSRRATDLYIAEMNEVGDIIWHKRYFNKDYAINSAYVLQKEDVGYYLLYSEYLSEEYYAANDLVPEYTKVDGIENVSTYTIASTNNIGDVLWKTKLEDVEFIRNQKILSNGNILILAAHKKHDKRQATEYFLYLLSPEGKILEKKGVNDSYQGNLGKLFIFWTHILEIDDNNLRILYSQNDGHYKSFDIEIMSQ